MCWLSVVYLTCSTNIFSASSNLRLRLYPATAIEIGSPSGAIFSTLIISPGTQPISINFKNMSFFSNECILALDPVDNSDNLFIATKVVWSNQTSLRFSEMPKASEANIHFHFVKQVHSFKNRLALKRFLVRLFKMEKQSLSSLNYIFCSDAYLLKINREYLKHDFLTDIITFPISTPGDPVEADIYISIDRVKENAANFKTTAQEELRRVIFHGALHLCGYNDKNSRQIKIMRQKEDDYLALYSR